MFLIFPKSRPSADETYRPYFLFIVAMFTLATMREETRENLIEQDMSNFIQIIALEPGIVCKKMKR